MSKQNHCFYKGEYFNLYITFKQLLFARFVDVEFSFKTIKQWTTSMKSPNIKIPAQ